MALISSIIKNSSKETVVKVEGASGNTTIALNFFCFLFQVAAAIKVDFEWAPLQLLNRG